MIDQIVRSRIRLSQQVDTIVQWNKLAEKQVILKEKEKVTQNVPNGNDFVPTENAKIELTKAKQIQTEIGTISSTIYGKVTLKVSAQ